MPDLRRWVVAGIVLAPFAVGAVTTSYARPSAPVAFTFADPEIAESSGLAVVDDHVVTTNDSGDAARVFTVDPTTGETVGVTTWADSAVDVEALAPAGRAEVWVADIGDNRRSRRSVLVARVPVGSGEREVAAPTYELVLPDGPRDAETLLAHPRTGRLLVVTKGVFAGQVLQAPARLRAGRPHRLRPVATVGGIVTDGTFLPDGRHVVLRTYAHGLLYAWPTWELLQRWELPEQRQGEAVAVDGDRLLLSSEGVHSDVLEVPWPTVASARELVGGAYAALRFGLP